jgi:hypothetical protein
MAPALSQREPEARSAMRVRQETDWYRVFKRDDSIDVLARAVYDQAQRKMARRKRLQVAQNQTWGCLDRRRCRDDVREGL